MGERMNDDIEELRKYVDNRGFFPEGDFLGYVADTYYPEYDESITTLFYTHNGARLASLIRAASRIIREKEARNASP